MNKVKWIQLAAAAIIACAATMLHAATPAWDSASSQAPASKDGLGMLSTEEPPIYKHTGEFDGKPFTITVTCSRWKDTFGTPVKIRVQDGRGNDEELTTGELALGLPAEGHKPYTIERDGLRSGDNLYPFETEDGIIHLATFLLLKDKAMAVTSDGQFPELGIPRFFNDLDEMTHLLNSQAQELIYTVSSHYPRTPMPPGLQQAMDDLQAAVAFADKSVSALHKEQLTQQRTRPWSKGPGGEESTRLREAYIPVAAAMALYRDIDSQLPAELKTPLLSRRDGVTLQP